jgi:hypothetical protein
MDGEKAVMGKFADEFFPALGRFLGKFTGLALAATFVWWLMPKPDRDVTDPPRGRSGLSLRIDHETGCQYLTAPLGAITPRLNGQGQHMGCKP